MAYVIVENFKGGLDTRRSVLASAPGTMSKAENVHITRGGELEKRKAFVAIDTGVDTEHQHPFEGTYGMESTGDGVTVFTTSYEQVSWLNSGRWIKFAYIFTGDFALSNIANRVSYDKLYYRFSNAATNSIHEVSLPAYSLSNSQIQIPDGATSIDISFTAPTQSFPYLTNYFNVKISGHQYQVVLTSDNGVEREGRSLPVNTSILDYGDVMIVDYDKTFNTTVTYNWGGNIGYGIPVGSVSSYSPLSNNTYTTLKAAPINAPAVFTAVATGGNRVGVTYPNPWIVGNRTNEGISEIAIIVTNSDTYLGVGVVGFPVTWERKSVANRITTTYTDVKVVEIDHPDFHELESIVYSTVFGGKTFVLAKFANGDVLPFYDGKLVRAFTDGVYRASHGSLYNFVESVSKMVQGGIDKAKENYVLDSSIDDQLRLYGLSTVETNDGTNVTITGPINSDFSVDVFADDPISYSIETVQKPAAPLDGQRATATFTLGGGSNGSASTGLTLRKIAWEGASIIPPISGIFITTDYDDPSLDIPSAIEITGLARNGTETIAYPFTGYTSSEAWDPNQMLAYAISFFINSASTSTGISSDYANYGSNWHKTDPGSFTVKSTPKLGGALNGRGVWIEFTSDTNLYLPGNNTTLFVDELIEHATVRVSPFDPTRFVARLGYGYRDYPTNVTLGKLINGARNSVDSVVANGVELLSDIDPMTMNGPIKDKAQYFESSIDQLASDVVNSINHGSSTHGYTASKDGAKITITSNVSGTAGNNRLLRVTTSGSVTRPSQTNFTGGRNNYNGLPKIVRIKFSGTPKVGNKLWIKITDPSRPDLPYKFGATRMAGKKGSFCFTYKGKQYLGVGSTLFFSALNDATKWDIYDVGSGFIDMSNNFGGREDLTGAGVYQNSIAVFTERNCQLWFLDPDPTLNSQRQVLDNTGCIAPGSVASVGAVDLFYLSYNGIRSLQSRESTDAAYSNDIGSAVDEIVIKLLSTITKDQAYEAKAIIEPTDGRYWVSIGSKLFVLSYFRGSNILAWSEYVTGFNVDEMVVFKGRVYVRSGDKIYLYGGNSGNQYDNSPVVVELPYLDANRPAGYKQVSGIDATCEGQWTVELGFDYTNPTARDTIAIISQPTFALGRITATGVGTHIGPRLTSTFNGYCRMANLIVHYSDLHSKHEG